MKKLMTILVFAGVLSVPSAVFAEASWYGSLRGGVEFSGGETNFYDGASRWGIRGSAEASEGLTAVYRFEHKFSTSNAGLPGGRLAFVGLSGGFGSLTLGQIWSASYNHAGVIRDFPNWYTSPDTSGRVGNALSYALSTDAFSMQIDAIMDGSKDTGKAIDQLEFGMTIGLGELGKVALSHTTVQDEHITKMVDVRSSALAAEPFITITVVDGKLKKTIGTLRDKTTGAIVESETLTNVMHTTGTGASMLTVMPVLVYSSSSTAPTGVEKHDDGYFTSSADGEDCEPGESGCNAYAQWVSVTYPAESTAGDDPTATYAPITDLTTISHTATATLPDMNPGSKSSHISVEFGLGALTAALGYSESKMNGASGKTKTTFVGASGSIGDTGLNWGAFSRVKNNADGTKDKPWTVGVSRTLGGGAWTYVEHGNDGDSGSTVVGLGVNF